MPINKEKLKFKIGRGENFSQNFNNLYIDMKSKSHKYILSFKINIKCKQLNEFFLQAILNNEKHCTMFTLGLHKLTQIYKFTKSALEES